MNLMTLSAQRRRVDETRSPGDGRSPVSNNYEATSPENQDAEQFGSSQANQTGQFKPIKEKNSEAPQTLDSKIRQDPQNHYFSKEGETRESDNQPAQISKNKKLMEELRYLKEEIQGLKTM